MATVRITVTDEANSNNGNDALAALVAAGITSGPAYDAVAKQANKVTNVTRVYVGELEMSHANAEMIEALTSQLELAKESEGGATSVWSASESKAIREHAHAVGLTDSPNARGRLATEWCDSAVSAGVVSERRLGH